MDFVDATLLRIADEAGRSQVLDQSALENWTAAAFDIDAAPVEGPYALDLESAELGIELPPRITLEGAWSAPGAPPTDARLRIEGLRVGEPLRVDALWRGRLIARQVPQDSHIDLVTTAFPSADVDRDVAAAPGGLPVDPEALETARRAALIARLRAGAAAPEAITDAVLDRMLRAAGAGSVAGLIAARGAIDFGAVRVRFTAPSATAAPAPILLPVTIALLVRDRPLKVAALLAESRAIRAALAADPSTSPAPVPLRRRTPVLVVWMVPAATFDDDGWPGANPLARRAAASTILQGQGIGLAVRAP